MGNVQCEVCKRQLELSRSGYDDQGRVRCEPPCREPVARAAAPTLPRFTAGQCVCCGDTATRIVHHFEYVSGGSSSLGGGRRRFVERSVLRPAEYCGRCAVHAWGMERWNRVSTLRGDPTTYVTWTVFTTVAIWMWSIFGGTGAVDSGYVMFTLFVSLVLSVLGGFIVYKLIGKFATAGLLRLITAPFSSPACTRRTR